VTQWHAVPCLHKYFREGWWAQRLLETPHCPVCRTTIERTTRVCSMKMPMSDDYMQVALAPIRTLAARDAPTS